MNQGRNFFVGLGLAGGVRSPNSIHFHIKIKFYWYYEEEGLLEEGLKDKMFGENKLCVNCHQLRV
jgi:hypothetical protein